MTPRPFADAPPRILLADTEVIAVDKPAGMPSVPARTPLDPPDVAAVVRAENLVDLGPSPAMLEAVHRLDRDTSGVMLLARTATARAALGRAFEARAVAKRYLALVEGLVDATGTIDMPLADDPLHPPRKRVDATFGRRALTRWRRLGVAGAEAGGWSLVELEPVTGRSHQLRAHLAWLGNPIVGDRLYGARSSAPDRRLALHAAWLEFPHPVDGRRVAVAAAVPATRPWSEVEPLTAPAWARAPTD